MTDKENQWIKKGTPNGVLPGGQIQENPENLNKLDEDGDHGVFLDLEKKIINPN